MTYKVLFIKEKSRLSVKKVIKALFVIMLILTTCIICILHRQKYSIGSVGKSIINEIDHSIDANGECTIDLKMVTNFEWDKVIIVSADFLAIGYSKEEIKNMWGIEYEFQPGFKSQLIFLKNNSIVHEESYLASIEHSERFNISVSPKLNYYCILSCDNACVTAGRDQYNSKEFCYSLIIE